MQPASGDLIKLADVKSARNPHVASLRQLIAHIEREIEADQEKLQRLDAEDANNYADGSSQAAEARQQQRALLEAGLKQKRLRIEGARRDLARREDVMVYQGVQRTRAEIEAKINEAVKLARQVDRDFAMASRGIRQLSLLGQEVLVALRGVRGRSTLTTEGHIPAGDFTELSNPLNYQFYAERMLVGLIPGWRSDYGAGPSFVDSAGGTWESMRSRIESLMGDHNFPPEVVRIATAHDQLPEIQSKEA